MINRVNHMLASAIGVDRLGEGQIRRSVAADDRAGPFYRDLSAATWLDAVNLFQRVEPIAIRNMLGKVEAAALAVQRCASALLHSHGVLEHNRNKSARPKISVP